MKYIDFLFYSYYCHFERRLKRHPKLFKGDSRFFALWLIGMTIGGPLGICYCLINDYVTRLPEMPKLNSPEEKLIGLVFGGIILGPLIYRYYYNKKICRKNYTVFKEKWGEDPRTNSKGRIAVIVYTIVALSFPLLGLLI